MTTRQAFIAAAAVSVAGTAGMAGWLALDAGELRGQAPAASLRPAAHEAATEAGVTETEAAVLPPPAAAELAPVAAAPATAPAPDWQAPVRPARQTAQPVARATRTTQPERAPARRPIEPATPPRELEREPARLEPTEPTARLEPIELVVPAKAILGVRLGTGVSSDTAEIEDRVEGSITRDVIADGRVAIPAGTRLVGSVNDVVRGGKVREAARLGVRFHTLVMDDGTPVPVRVDAIVREGSAPARKSAAKIGAGAVGGAIIGGIMGGKKGALIGGAAGAGAGTAAVAAGDRSVAELVAGALLSVRLTSPVAVMIERR